MKKLCCVILSFILCFILSSCNEKRVKTFEDDIITPSNGVYADLGNYIVLLDEYKHADYGKALEYQKHVAKALSGACTAIAKKNSKGEVIIGRNLDMCVSSRCSFIMKTSFAKYKTIQFRYIDYDFYDYEEFKNSGYKDADFLNYIVFSCSDAMNECGLYIEANVREANEGFQSSGSNPGLEEVNYSTLVAKVAQNCATVEEAIDYLKNDINYVSAKYTSPTSPTDYGYMIGDASGEYGLIEIVNNEVFYLPYQNAQANFYINPIYNVVDNTGSGYGRYEMALDGLEKVETKEEIKENMKKAMWKNETLYADLTYIDEDGKVCFVDDKGNKTIDWRSDLYLYQIKDVWPEEEIDEVFGDKNNRWFMDDKNAETVLKYCKDIFIKNGGKKDLIDYYNGDDESIRNNLKSYTTGISFGVNCKQKSMILTFYEKDNLTYEFSFK